MSESKSSQYRLIASPSGSINLLRPSRRYPARHTYRLVGSLRFAHKENAYALAGWREDAQFHFTLAATAARRCFGEVRIGTEDPTSFQCPINAVRDACGFVLACRARGRFALVNGRHWAALVLLTDLREGKCSRCAWHAEASIELRRCTLGLEEGTAEALKLASRRLGNTRDAVEKGELAKLGCKRPGGLAPLLEMESYSHDPSTGWSDCMAAFIQ